MNKTQVIRVTPADTGTASATSQIYEVDLIHQICCNQICDNTTNLVGNLTFAVDSVVSLGQSLWQINVTFSGQVVYVPYRQNTCCGCAVTDTIYGSFSVPVYSATQPSVTADDTGSIVVVKPISNNNNCCTTRNIGISTALIITTATATQAVQANRIK